MRYGSTSALCAVLFLLLASPAGFAQKRFCPKPPPSPYKHSGEIVTSFDGAARRMRTTLRHPRALAGAEGAFHLAATFIHEDPRQGVTPRIELIVHGSSAAGFGTAGGDVSFLADGRTLAPTRPANFKTRPSRGGADDSAVVSLSLDEVTSLTGARKVSVRFGSSELTLTHNHLEALRELVSQMGPTPSRWSEATAGIHGTL